MEMILGRGLAIKDGEGQAVERRPGIGLRSVGQRRIAIVKADDFAGPWALKVRVISLTLWLLNPSGCQV
jgi:hypothetical protein